MTLATIYIVMNDIKHWIVKQVLAGKSFEVRITGDGKDITYKMEIKR